jgi:hypothetical protein
VTGFVTSRSAWRRLLRGAQAQVVVGSLAYAASKGYEPQKTLSTTDRALRVTRR